MKRNVNNDASCNGITATKRGFILVFVLIDGRMEQCLRTCVMFRGGHLPSVSIRTGQQLSHGIPMSVREHHLASVMP